ncbi:hypothetical protein FVEG_16776 [Fusarium verticillioides 7600]|uniref:Uncharacterized protein n=1 Tax=Gibberella moniliformis (strain M3125 / FGSC 7600) TaxID=334819 RepID=W7N381_GIBM7|nr:hypothetical protein FVEG_16776 [Fusarium verticillioides 7600]EWG51227.1 hypothetical protein FVEG_16776 [Fusarium verticillioides 7600]
MFSGDLAYVRPATTRKRRNVMSIALRDMKPVRTHATAAECYTSDEHTSHKEIAERMLHQRNGLTGGQEATMYTLKAQLHDNALSTS